MPEARGTCGGVAALVFLLFFILPLFTSAPGVLLPEDLLGAKPQQLVLQRIAQVHLVCRNVDTVSLHQDMNRLTDLDIADCIDPASPLGGAVGLEGVGSHCILELVEVDEDE